MCAWFKILRNVPTGISLFFGLALTSYFPSQNESSPPTPRRRLGGSFVLKRLVLIMFQKAITMGLQVLNGFEAQQFRASLDVATIPRSSAWI